jgi:proteasome lid subunit RPN8/RPN11
MLCLTDRQYHCLRMHAAQQYPEECCGLLLGPIDGESDLRQVLEVRPMENQWRPELGVLSGTTSPDEAVDRRRRYWIDPKDLLKAQKDARDRNWQVIGVYHSHPDHPAIPSERDRAMAWSGYSYPIVSVQSGQVVAVQSWRLQEDGHFKPEPITVTVDTDREDLELR